MCSLIIFASHCIVSLSFNFVLMYFFSVHIVLVACPGVIRGDSDFLPQDSIRE